MREIKFREWDGKDMIYGILPYTNKIIMQYTGLKDNFGNQIYEGDIIGQKFFHNNPPSQRPKEKYKFVKLPVIFDDGVFRLDDTEMRSTKYGTTYGNWWQGCEIFGNIYENPELITNI